ncbi:MAG: LLM class F420-dependent oxidoreductase [Pseudomonadales bacterium]|nr:LLM class F420-dependent oxidoreductase [Pseudomonadales bacterium]
MKIGALIFATDYAVRMDELAPEMESRGYDSLFIPEHTHIPASRESAWPGGADLPLEYSHTYDPFVALSFAAASTTRLKLGTGICLLPQRDTITTAKSVSSLDHLSRGRFIFGIGGGWNKEEMRQHGTEYSIRFARMREQILAMRGLWTEEASGYQGEHVKIEPSWLHPKPFQRHLPVILGGETDYTLKRIVEYGDGWLPRARHGFDAKENIARLKMFADEAGRDMAELSISVFGVAPEKAVLDDFREAGIDRAILPLPPADKDKVFSILDRYQELLN